SEFARATTSGPLTASTGSAAAGRIDLLTVLLHEVGHVLGYDHDVAGDPHGQVMDAVLQPGHRALLNDGASETVAHGSGLDSATRSWWSTAAHSGGSVQGFSTLDLSSETNPLTVTVKANGDVQVSGSASSDGTHSGITDITSGSGNDIFIREDG